MLIQRSKPLRNLMAGILFDKERNRLLIQSQGTGEMSVLLRTPSKKWLSKAQTFVVPVTRINCRHILEAGGAGQIKIPNEMLELLRHVAYKSKAAREFPNWYTFKLQPFPDQRAALLKCYADDAFALFMRMGTGKSKVFIDMFTAHFYEQRIQAAVLICPNTVRAVWAGPTGQLASHSPCPYKVIQVDSSFDASAVKLTSNVLTWLLVSVESLSQGKAYDRLLPFLQTYKCAVGVDESSRIKNSKAIRTKKVITLGALAAVKGIGTGTPATRNLMDVYSQYEFLDPYIIGAGDYYAFRNRYAVMGGFKRREIIGYDNVEELMSLVEPYTYRCDKPKGMPEQLWAERYVTLADEQKEMYRKLKKAEIVEVKVANILNRMGKLQEIVGGFLREDPKETVHPITGRKIKVQGKIIWTLDGDKNPKVQALHEVIEEMGDEQLIIWCKYLWEIEQAMAVVKTHGTAVKFTGEVPDSERSALVQRFQDGGHRFMVANQQVGGIGHTMTAAHFSIYYSNTNSLEDRLQSEDRIHRTGQDSNCLYTDLLADHTVDMAIRAAIKEKKDLDAYVRDMLDAAGKKAIDQLLGDI